MQIRPKYLLRWSPSLGKTTGLLSVFPSHLYFPLTQLITLRGLTRIEIFKRKEGNSGQRGGPIT